MVGLHILDISSPRLARDPCESLPMFQRRVRHCTTFRKLDASFIKVQGAIVTLYHSGKQRYCYMQLRRAVEHAPNSPRVRVQMHKIRFNANNKGGKRVSTTSVRKTRFPSPSRNIEKRAGEPLCFRRKLRSRLNVTSK